MALAIDSFPTGLDKVLVSDADTGIAGEMLRVTAALMGALAIASGVCSIHGPNTPERHSSSTVSLSVSVFDDPKCLVLCHVCARSHRTTFVRTQARHNAGARMKAPCCLPPLARR